VGGLSDFRPHNEARKQLLDRLSSCQMDAYYHDTGTVDYAGSTPVGPEA